MKIKASVDHPRFECIKQTPLFHRTDVGHGDQ
ncbi:Uncharacterised protein [Vibrio cholerae]|nr:Uncharacterised protein [Vibrio cholerae]